MTNLERAGYVADAEISALKMAVRLTSSDYEALHALFVIIIAGALDAVSLPPADRTAR